MDQEGTAEQELNPGWRRVLALYGIGGSRPLAEKEVFPESAGIGDSRYVTLDIVKKYP